MSTATKISSNTKIFCVGLRVDVDCPPYFRDLYGTPAEIKSKIEDDVVRTREAGYDITLKYLDDRTHQKSLDEVTNKIGRAHV